MIFWVLEPGIIYSRELRSGSSPRYSPSFLIDHTSDQGDVNLCLQIRFETLFEGIHEKIHSIRSSMWFLALPACGRFSKTRKPKLWFVPPVNNRIDPYPSNLCIVFCEYSNPRNSLIGALRDLYLNIRSVFRSKLSALIIYFVRRKIITRMSMRIEIMMDRIPITDISSSFTLDNPATSTGDIANSLMTPPINTTTRVKSSTDGLIVGLASKIIFLSFFIQY